MDKLIKEPFISVIIPVYNAKKYLKKCLNSILKQSFKDIEVLCIDDCSTDDSYKILKKFAQKDRRIKIFKNSANMGAGYSRNIGIMNSLGDYCLFVDADDWLNKDSLNIIIDYLSRDKSIDFIQYGMNYKHPLFKITFDCFMHSEDIVGIPIKIKKNPSAIEQLDYKINKVINLKFLKSNNIKFNINNKTLEDVEFTLDLIKNATNILFVNDRIYNYRISVKNSVSSKIPDFVDYNANFIQRAKFNLKNFNSVIQDKVFNNLYKLFLINILNSYFNKKIDFNSMIDLINTNINYSVLCKYSSKYYIDLYNSIKYFSEKEFKKKYYLKFIIKKRFYFLYLLYINIKKRLKHSYI